MNSGLGENDGQAVARAIRILTEAGYSVERSGNASRRHSGVEFELTIQAPTRMAWFQDQSEAVKQAAIDAPEFNMAGQEVREE